MNGCPKCKKSPNLVTLTALTIVSFPRKCNSLSTTSSLARVYSHVAFLCAVLCGFPRCLKHLKVPHCIIRLLCAKHVNTLQFERHPKRRWKRAVWTILYRLSDSQNVDEYALSEQSLEVRATAKTQVKKRCVWTILRRVCDFRISAMVLTPSKGSIKIWRHWHRHLLKLRVQSRRRRRCRCLSRNRKRDVYKTSSRKSFGRKARSLTQLWAKKSPLSNGTAFANSKFVCFRNSVTRKMSIKVA